MGLFGIVGIDPDVIQVYYHKDTSFLTKILLIYLWKLDEALDRPKGITWYLKWLYLVQKTIFYILLLSILIQ